MDNHLVFPVGKVVGNVGGMEEIIREILLDDVLLIAGADNEFVEAMGGV